MKRYAVVAAIAMSIAFGAQALAQAVSVEIAPEQRTKINEYVVKNKVLAVTVKGRVTVGATLPADIELRTLPADGVRRSPSIATSITTITSCLSSRWVVHVID